jgi:lipopolysaccharide export system protein LptC
LKPNIVFNQDVKSRNLCIHGVRTRFPLASAIIPTHSRRETLARAGPVSPHNASRGNRLGYSSIIPPSTSRAPRQIGRSEGDRVFRAAARHRRFVRFLRSAIPVGIVAIVAIMLVATFFNPSRLFASFPIDPGEISLSGTKVVMELPRVSGFTGNAQPYEFTARAATQDLTKPDILELKDINALVELKDGQRVTIKSINGVYNTKGDVLSLNDHIAANSTSGYEGHLSEATVNTASANIVSESPVE